jgi:outer membrane protein OmpA-like peptidoglycan-associated protein
MIGVLVATALPRAALADEGWASLSATAAKAVAGDQRTELGPGGAMQLTVRQALGARLSLQVEGTALALLHGQAPRDPSLAARPDASLFGVAAGVALRPFGRRGTGVASGLWLDANGGVATTGGLTRPLVDSHVGWDLRAGSSLAIGPTAGFVFVPQPQSDVRPDAASIALLGLRITAVSDVPKVEMLAPLAPLDLPPRDRDGDGIPDDKDACPDQPEDRDGFEDEDGCPDPDDDRDGVLDAFDRCPREAEDRDGFEDQDGCPDPDNDQDGIPDVRDKCPNEPETVNGFEDDDGCPDEVGMRATTSEIKVDDRIQFEIDKATLTVGSRAVVARLAKLLVAHPEYSLVSIEGHADDRGTEKYNEQLSERRAQAVRDVLVKGGVGAARLATVGYGESRPRVQGANLTARAENRRVEFKIVSRARDDDGRTSAGGAR